MGVDRNDYLVYGWKMPYSVVDEIEEDDDGYYMPNDYGIETIIDGMGGKYIVFGSILASADEYAGWEPVDIQELNPTTTLDQFSEVFDKHSKVPLSVTIYIHQLDTKPKLFLFSHFS